jgi:hypothetical protein
MIHDRAAGRCLGFISIRPEFFFPPAPLFNFSFRDGLAYRPAVTGLSRSVLTVTPETSCMSNYLIFPPVVNLVFRSYSKKGSVYENHVTHMYSTPMCDYLSVTVNKGCNVKPSGSVFLQSECGQQSIPLPVVDKSQLCDRI